MGPELQFPTSALWDIQKFYSPSQFLSFYLRIRNFPQGCWVLGSLLCAFLLSEMSSCHCLINSLMPLVRFLKNIYILSSFRKVFTLLSSCMCVLFCLFLFCAKVSHYTNQVKDSLSLNKRVNKTLKYYFTETKRHFSFLSHSNGLMTYGKEKPLLFFLQWLS